MCEAPGDSRGRVRNAAAFRPAVLINARCRALARPKLFCGRPTLKGFSIHPRLLPGFLDCSSFPEPLRLLNLAGAKATHLTFRRSPTEGNSLWKAESCPVVATLTTREFPDPALGSSRARTSIHPGYR